AGWIVKTKRLYVLQLRDRVRPLKERYVGNFLRSAGAEAPERVIIERDEDRAFSVHIDRAQHTLVHVKRRVLRELVIMYEWMRLRRLTQLRVGGDIDAALDAGAGKPGEHTGLEARAERRVELEDITRI